MKWIVGTVLISVCFCKSAYSNPLTFRITLSPNDFTFGAFEFGSHTYMPFFPDSDNSSNVASTGGTKRLDFGQIRFGGSMSLAGTQDWSDAWANFGIRVDAIGRPGSGSTSAVLTGQRIFWRSSPAPVSVLLHKFSQASKTISFNGGSCGITASLYPSSATLELQSQGYDWQAYDIETTTRFYLSDPSIRISTNNLTLNTNSSAGDSASSVEFGISQTFAAFVDSVSVDFGDGYSSSVAFSQASSLKFSTAASHDFTLPANQDAKVFAVTGTAYGPSDNSSDNDQSSDSVNVTLLRSPLAALNLDGTAIPSATIVDVTPGQVLSFDGSPAVGFIDNAVLTLGGDEVMTNTSVVGEADKLFQDTFIVPSLSLGDDIVLQYLTSNTGAGLNSNTWSVTLHVVPEPATFCLVSLGSVILARRRRRLG